MTARLNEDELYVTAKILLNQAFKIDLWGRVGFMTEKKCVFSINLMFCLKSCGCHTGIQQPQVVSVTRRAVYLFKKLPANPEIDKMSIIPFDTKVVIVNHEQFMLVQNGDAFNLAGQFTGQITR